MYVTIRWMKLEISVRKCVKKSKNKCWIKFIHNSIIKSFSHIYKNFSLLYIAQFITISLQNFLQWYKPNDKQNITRRKERGIITSLTSDRDSYTCHERKYIRGGSITVEELPPLKPLYIQWRRERDREKKRKEEKKKGIKR